MLMAKYERAAAETYRLLMVAKLDKVPADRIEGAGLSSPVPDGMIEPPRLPCLGHRFQAAILCLQDIGAAETGQRAQSPVAELTGQPDGLIQVPAGADGVAEQESQPAKMLAGRRHPGEIA